MSECLPAEYGRWEGATAKGSVSRRETFEWRVLGRGYVKVERARAKVDAKKVPVRRVIEGERLLACWRGRWTFPASYLSSQRGIHAGGVLG
jgi:hypothetical protein